MFDIVLFLILTSTSNFKHILVSQVALKSKLTLEADLTWKLDKTVECFKFKLTMKAFNIPRPYLTNLGDIKVSCSNGNREIAVRVIVMFNCM